MSNRPRRSIFVSELFCRCKEEKYATQAAEIGAVDYIFKPINPDILRSRVKVYLDFYVQRGQILKLNGTLSRLNADLEQVPRSCCSISICPGRMAARCLP
jgi:two-component system sensor histidine kinase/response regulator